MIAAQSAARRPQPMQVSRSILPRLASRSAGCLLAALLALIAAGIGRANAQPAAVPCNNQDLPPQGAMTGGPPNTPNQPDLMVTGACTVRPGQAYYYNNVNVLANGKLIFTETHADNTTPGDEQTDLWVASIIIEGDGTAQATNGGVMRAGTSAVPYGNAGQHTGTLTIHLYGADQSKGNPFVTPGQGVLCKSTQTQNVTGPCGIPWDRWVDNGKTLFTDLPSGVSDYFYQYGPLMGDGAGTQFSASPYTPGTQGYFGYKVLAVSYGGTLQLFGYKGTPTADPTPKATDSANSWMRLGADLAANQTQLTLASAPGDKWKAGDKIVVTTTDYLPGHSEELQIQNITGTTVTFTPATKWAHKGTRYTLPGLPGNAADYGRLGLDPSLTTNGVEDRAAVALLTRSIRIVSAGNTVTGVPANDDFPAASTGYFFGGHVVFRQGFSAVQIQGVEFAQLGQGGRIGRYPVHFHMTRSTPPNTFVEDSAVNESMTRWYVIHSTHNVLLARDVGYLSIGHGYYLEDGTEIDNQLYSNIGIMARAAVQNAQNPRNVPGILAYTAAGSSLQYNSDVVNPTVFWISNGWNDFSGNMAVGATTCGACYWLLPSLNSDMPDVFPMQPPGTPLPHMTWLNPQGQPTYAGLATQLGISGATPLKSFFQNYCSSAQNAFQTVGGVSACLHVSPPSTPLSTGEIVAVQSISPQPVSPQEADMYYPRLSGNRQPVVCPNGNCTGVTPCDTQNPSTCAVTVLDHFTSSFSWAEQNFSAVWLRTNWYLLTDSVLSDVQTGGLTFISGGDYTRSSVPEGYWDLVGHSLFIGETQPNNPFAYDLGPFNADSLKLDPTLTCKFTDACVNVPQAVSFPLSNFGTGQRMFNIYDGPVYQDSNAFLDILTHASTGRACNTANNCIYLNVQGVRRNPADGTSYMPNAAIGWKQSNGFYYPPAFHSTNLLFVNVDIRHYVIAPLFNPGTYLTYLPGVQHDYASAIGPTYFNGYTDIDRQTELNDDDGTLTGLTNNTAGPLDTISVNEDPFFNAPVATPECDSNVKVSPNNACVAPPATMPTPTARTSPYDYVTTIVYPDCAVTDLSLSACGSYPTYVPPTVVYGPPPANLKYTKFTNQLGRGGAWSQDCAGPYCFGLKLYRQLLTGTPPDPTKPAVVPTREWLEWTNAGCGQTPANCDWPYGRMAGASLWQRSILTANNGLYYIDTTVTANEQVTSSFAGSPTDTSVSTVECSQRPPNLLASCEPRSITTFQAGQTYYVLLSYAKPTTNVTYQIYVGKGFQLSSVTGVAAFAPGIHLGISKTLPASWPDSSAWLTPAPKMVNGADGQPDVLQVTVNLASFGPTNLLNPTNVAGGLCKPGRFCGWVDGKCTFMSADTIDSRVAANPGVLARMQSACSNWAVKDIDYPDQRLIGFSFTMGSQFVASNQNERPTPIAFPGPTPTDWSRLFTQTKLVPDSATGGACYYPSTNLPGSPGNNCMVNDPSNTMPPN
jgi:hypothetical protein